MPESGSLEKSIRTEQEVFYDLEVLCKSPGYAHVLSILHFRDSFLKIGGELKAADIANLNSPDALCGNELSVLVGLMIKSEDCLTSTLPENFSYLIKRTDELMAELHDALNQEFHPIFIKALESGTDVSPFKCGLAHREPIFYSGQSAYDFQFRSFSLDKYKNDNDWFLSKKGYSILDAVKILEAIPEIQTEKFQRAFVKLSKGVSQGSSPLECLTFCISDVTDKTGMSEKVVNSFLHSFVCPENVSNDLYKSIDDFNCINAYPLIKTRNAEFVCFSSYALSQAFYETPFYWMNADESYRSIASDNRGKFTESFSRIRLESVFGKDRVFQGVTIRKKGKKDIVGEIDVLVLFGDRAIVLQAKSKKLTVLARKGNELALTKDFRESVQSSYDQGLGCSEFLLSSDFELFEASGKKLESKYKVKEAYIICVVSDHYPALNFQARNFLNYVDTETIAPPLVTDVFFLDVLCEMLQSPLLLISYLNRRLRYFEKILSSNEFSVLGYHLCRNLWIDGDNTNFFLADDLATDLDIAMLSRRSSLTGEKTPSGLLTKLANQDLPLGKILKEIESKELPSIIEFGLLVLMFSEETIQALNRGVKKITTLSKNDGRQHDISIAIAETGVTLHSNDASMEEAMKKLRGHCALRKYDVRARKWFGLLISSGPNFQLRNGLELDYEHVYSKEVESQLSQMPKVSLSKNGKMYDFSVLGASRKKVGRNDPCSCGSGLKFKKCCL